MSALQVKNVPDELRSALVARAERDGVSISEFMLRALRREVERSTMSDWVAERRLNAGPVHEIDTLRALNEARAESDPDERFPIR